MANQCYAQVRGSVIRVTGLSARGAVAEPITYAVSKSLTTVTIDEVTESGTVELLRTAEDVPRFRFNTPERTIRYKADISLIRCDPGLVSLLTGVPTVTNYAGDVAGFDSNTRLPAKAFSLEVWSKLSSAQCATGLKWGYTLFPFLKGGYLSGFTFSNGLVSFKILGAKTRRYSRWGTGPYNIHGTNQRTHRLVSGNTHWRQGLVGSAPPTQTDGSLTTTDVFDGGTALTTTSDVLDGQTVTTTDWIIDGGAA